MPYPSKHENYCVAHGNSYIFVNANGEILRNSTESEYLWLKKREEEKEFPDLKNLIEIAEKHVQSWILSHVEMGIQSVFSIVEEYRNKAGWSRHQYSESSPCDPVPCTDRAVVSFLKKIFLGKEQVELLVSDIKWAHYGNCTGDELFPVTLNGMRLPDGRYFLELLSSSENLEYIYSPEKNENDVTD